MTCEDCLPWQDYAVFGLLLIVSISVGIYFSYKERNQSSEAYLLNNDAMNPYAAGLSIFVSLISALTVIAMPVEIYIFGNGMIWRLAGGIIGAIILNNTFVPFLHEQKAFSIFSYIENRFNGSKAVKIISLSLGVIAMVFHTMCLSYLTALALSTVTGISVPVSLFMLNGVALFYTMLGGMKAVIWTDVLQSGVLVFSLAAVSFKLWFDLGYEKILADVQETGGNKLADIFDLRITTRSSAAWFFNEINIMVCHIGFGQYFVQRFVSCATPNDAKKSIWVGASVSLIVGGVFIPMIGMASISYFRGCDPVKSGKISRIDAIVPLLVQEIFSEIPGMTGVFISSAYSATLSTISTALNSGATIFFTSIIGNVDIKEEKRIFYMRIFITIFGIIVTFLSMLFIYMPGNIIGIALMVLGSFQAPLTMIFLLGILVPSTNEYGIIAGTIASQIPLALLSLQKMFFPKPASFQNLVHHTADVCMNVSSVTVLLEPVPQFVEQSYPWWHRIFWVSKVGWNGFLAMAIMGVVSCVVSRIYRSKTKEPNPKLHLSLFTSPMWPDFLRNAFLLECHKNARIEEVKILTEDC